MVSCCVLAAIELATDARDFITAALGISEQITLLPLTRLITGRYPTVDRHPSHLSPHRFIARKPASLRASSVSPLVSSSTATRSSRQVYCGHLFTLMPEPKPGRLFRDW